MLDGRSLLDSVHVIRGGFEAPVWTPEAPLAFLCSIVIPPLGSQAPVFMVGPTQPMFLPVLIINFRGDLTAFAIGDK